MNNKIIYAVLAVLFVATTVIGIHVYSQGATVSQAESNYGSLFVTPQTSWGDTYTLAWGTNPGSAATTLIDSLGNWVGNLLQNTTTKNQFGPTFFSASGFAGPFSASTTFTGAQLLADTNQQWLNTTTTATGTLPAATSTYLAFGSPNNGEYFPFLVTNDSTNTVNYVAGTGTTFKCETSGVGTSTVIGGCTSSQISILATTTVQAQMYWDSASTTEVILWGNNYH